MAEFLQILGKMLTHLRHARSAEQCVDDRVQDHVAVLVPDQPEVVPDLESAEKQWVTGGCVMQVRADPDSPFIRHSNRPIEVQVLSKESRSVHHNQQRPKVPGMLSPEGAVPSALDARFFSYPVVE